MKKLLTLIIFFFILTYSASSLKTFEINETEKISLAPEAEDPDSDNLIYTFSDPLDENGEWQTEYGDNGKHVVTITVSDGENDISEDVLIIVNRKEAKPTIDDFEPKEEVIAIDEGDYVRFRVSASDLNNDELNYKWVVNGEIYEGEDRLKLSTDYEDAGKFEISVVVSDGMFIVNKKWEVIVEDVNVDSILEQIENVEVVETETVNLKLPDFEQYGLTYSISEPIGNGNSWKTGFNDAGEHKVTVSAEGNNYYGEKEVTVTVRKKDRAPRLVGLRSKSVKEGQQLRIVLDAVDPDDDEVVFSVENIPNNAKLEGNVFTWVPDHNFVQKNDMLDYILSKFRLLSRSTKLTFVAQSRDLKDDKSIKITVKDTNAPFFMENIDDIEVDEGQEISINPSYTDSDGDTVRFSYSGFMNTNYKIAGFDDAGKHIVKVIGTDGIHTQTKFVNVKVNNINRKPSFKMIENALIVEGSELKFELNAFDPENDALTYSDSGLPIGASLKDNLFSWKPGFDVVEGTKKEFSVKFLAFDGKDKSEHKVKITVVNKNQVPEILSSSDNLVVYKGQATLFEVEAVDGDGDELRYEWSFGFLEKFVDSNQHQRIFTSSGSKKVSVKVTDGVDSITKVWNVEVI